jgi:hypothetical protein
VRAKSTNFDLFFVQCKSVSEAETCTLVKNIIRAISSLRLEIALIRYFLYLTLDDISF